MTATTVYKRTEMKPTLAILTATFLMMVCTTCAADTDKTLVAWVTLADKNVRAGSILTIQNGPEFDGIVFAERDPGKWMAGSSRFERTQKDRSKTASEKADNNTQVQMAIVYKGDEIQIFRNGELYSQYGAKNIDLLTSKNSVAVFGLRHIGGDGSIAGAIDDARIYGKALTADEIQALQPNQTLRYQAGGLVGFRGRQDRSTVPAGLVTTNSKAGRNSTQESWC